jgi:hypothetical protein
MKLTLRRKFKLIVEILKNQDELDLSSFKNGADSERNKSLKVSAGREIGTYMVRTIRGEGLADWDGQSWRFHDKSIKSGILDVYNK